MKFLDLFAGIGGFRMALERQGHECVGFCEIDKFARSSYKAIYNTEGEVEFHDITRVRNEEWRQFRGRVDIICGGFPCQAFSIAGKRRGFLDETRGTLFFEIARAAQEIKPSLLLLENVKGLLSHDKGRTFRTILSTLDELGYDAEWQILNSKDFGVPQNRERVFIIGHSRRYRPRFLFPLRRESTTFAPKSKEIIIVGNTKTPTTKQKGTKSVVYHNKGLIGTLMATDYKEPKQVAIPVLTPDRLEKRQNGRRFKTDGDPMFTLTSQDRHGILLAGHIPSVREQSGRVSDPNGLSGLSPTLSTMQGGGQEPKIIQRARGYNRGGEHTISPTLSSHSWQENNVLCIREATLKGYAEAGVGDSVNLSHPNSKTRRGRVGKGVANTLLTGEEQGVVTSQYRIRKLTPRECWRLQGFPDWAFDRAKEVNSNSQLYKQAGNSVTVNVIEAIAKQFE
ncbi:UNVERIFIED_CONTAM: DNA (cytosine-5-)-methyltransferase [Streptococcus canis]|uniref:DNA (cytosine-5-)-methyltransferase n=5 Tax=Streptococcus canis TaxID=1329 RepID=UPI000B8AB40A|nr:DNA (cytosine-5-)-methyltransferase [Streptococcus canis]MDW7797685.1 DNA (cytosine-5-)-methyltransferase [Streptococcus canis]QJD13076.1 DNA (cytosine-5-)-methyltransferase [Streptococcus canis]VTR80749.1 DNA (cytosine-5-)-methyltransferase [Streptococcus canis]GFE42882.1 cytosine-specific methyltransferase [Streptococcus canis]GFG48487.1 cytosine-specific methyltransferase [Streptococcus canis]